MKKIALTSLLAVFAVSGAHAAGVVVGNPLYMPKAGHFYSETSLASHSENETLWTLGETFGYGITDKLAVAVETSAWEAHEFDNIEWGNLKLGATYRALDMGAWKLDAYGAYSLTPVWGDHETFLDKISTFYTWTLGVRGGYTTARWTIAGHAAFNYTGTESFNWNEEGAHVWALGLDAQCFLDSHLSLLAGAEYKGITDEGAKNAGTWHGTLGANYNIDAAKYVGLYVSGDMAHGTGDWKVADGFGFGAKFGIDF